MRNMNLAPYLLNERYVNAKSITNVQSDNYYTDIKHYKCRMRPSILFYINMLRDKMLAIKWAR